MVGITAYGTYIPRLRMKTADIAAVWRKREQDVVAPLAVYEKSVAALDEDAVTLAVAAGSRAVGAASLNPQHLGAVFVGSESHPYAVNPTSTIVGEFLGAGTDYLAVDLEFACKAATAGMQAIAGLIAGKQIRYGLTIGSDTAQAKPHDVLEYTAASGAAAFVLGGKKSEVIVEIVDFASYSSDTPDFWRRDRSRYPTHSGRFTGKPAYFAHVAGASQTLLKKTNMRPADFDYCVFHMPNGKFPRMIAKRLGFNQQQLAPSLVVERIGNPYSASSLLGLAAVLDSVKPGQTIFFCSYGSGAGADSFVFKTTKNIARFRPTMTVADAVADKTYISYVEYLRQRSVI